MPDANKAKQRLFITVVEFLLLFYSAMGYICAVKNCSNKKKGDSCIQYFCFPTIRKNSRDKLRKLCEDRRRQWLANIRRKDLDDKRAGNKGVCSEHFVNGSPSSVWDTTDPDWAPTLKLGHGDICNSSIAVERNARAKSRKRRRQEIADMEAEIAETVVESVESPQVETEPTIVQEFKVSEPTTTWGGRVSDKHLTEHSRIL